MPALRNHNHGLEEDIMSEESIEQGRRMYGEVFGQERLKRMEAEIDDFDRRHRHWIVEQNFGEVWSDPALSIQQRFLNVLCLTAALNRMSQFEAYFRAAAHFGRPIEQLRATLEQIASYAGLPAGSDAFRIAKRVLAESDAPQL